jgi:hypothetical protein
VQFWGAMKLAPDPVAIARRLGVSDPADTVALGRRAWREGARAWTGCYRIVASRQFGVPGILKVHELALHAAHRARPRRRLRRWLEVAARACRARAFRPRALGAASGRGPPRAGARGRARARARGLRRAFDRRLDGSGGGARLRPTVARLFPGAPPDRLDWDRCRRAAVLLWDTMESGGARTAWDVPDPAQDVRVHAEEA